MAQTKYPFEEFTRVAWLPAVADLSAPTTAEIAAGTELSCLLTRDGLSPNLTTNGVDGGSLCDRFDAQTAGSVSASPTLKFWRFDPTDSPGDEAWDLVNWGDSGALIIRRGIRVSVAWAASQAVEAYAGQFGEPQPLASAANTNQSFEVGLFISAVDQKAIVSAGS